MTTESWQLQNDVKMDAKTAADVAKIACALQSLSVYTAQAVEESEEPDALKAIVDEGLEAMKRVFVW